jgi:hypothetical protein
MANFTCRIEGDNLEQLNDRLVKFLKGKNKLLKGRTIDTHVDDEKKEYWATITIADESLSQRIKEKIKKMSPRERVEFEERLAKFLDLPREMFR